MAEYHNYGVNLTKGQASKIMNAHRNGNGATIELSKNNLVGKYKLPKLSSIESEKLKLESG